MADVTLREEYGRFVSGERRPASDGAAMITDTALEAGGGRDI